MAESSQKSNNYGLAVVGGVSAMTGIALQVKPEDAVSNLSLWLEFFGVNRVPNFLATTQADTWGTAIGFAVAILSFVVWWRKRSRSAKSPTGVWLMGHGLDHLKVSAVESPATETKSFPTPKMKRERSAFEKLLFPTFGETADKLLKDREAEEEAARQRLIRQAKEPDEFGDAFKERARNKIPFVRLRDIAPEFGIDLSSSETPTANLAYDIEGALRQAAVDGDLTVWGRKYQGPVQSNEPLVKIPASHFAEFEFGHGNLHYKTENRFSHTGKIAKRLEEMAGQVYFDLQLSDSDARAVLRQYAEDLPQ